MATGKILIPSNVVSYHPNQPPARTEKTSECCLWTIVKNFFESIKNCFTQVFSCFFKEKNVVIESKDRPPPPQPYENSVVADLNKRYEKYEASRSEEKKQKHEAYEAIQNSERKRRDLENAIHENLQRQSANLEKVIQQHLDDGNYTSAYNALRDAELPLILLPDQDKHLLNIFNACIKREDQHEIAFLCLNGLSTFSDSELSAIERVVKIHLGKGNYTSAYKLLFRTTHGCYLKHPSIRELLKNLVQIALDKGDFDFGLSIIDYRSLSQNTSLFNPQENLEYLKQIFFLEYEHFNENPDIQKIRSTVTIETIQKITSSEATLKSILNWLIEQKGYTAAGYMIISIKGKEPFADIYVDILQKIAENSDDAKLKNVSDLLIKKLMRITPAPSE